MKMTVKSLLMLCIVLSGAANVEAGAESRTTVEAIVMEDGPPQYTRRMPMLFSDIRERNATIGGRQVKLYCSNDGVAEVVTYLDGKFYATGGTAQSRIDKGHFWIVVNGKRKAPLNAKRSNKAEWFQVNWSALRDNVEAMCPAAWGGTGGALQRTVDAMKRANENYNRNASRFGLEK